ncbi:MAG: cytochrome-c peroxidase, partial [Planctomycetota bacterium]
MSAGLARGQFEFPQQPVPLENPITEPKRVLGKILFWDEQLSSDNTTACGTCHVPGAGGIDLVQGRHPGPDGILGTNDDIGGANGVVRSDAFDEYAPDPTFGFGVQVTGRASMPNFNMGFANELFWDGRASDRTTPFA